MSFLGPDTPGPGSYQPVTRGSRDEYNPSFTLKPKRRESSRAHDSPGPASYRLANGLGLTAPAHRFAGKYRDISLLHGPGPNAYNIVPPRKNSPSYTFGSKTKVPKWTDSVPGPGAHSPREHTSMIGSEILTKKRSPRPSFMGHTRSSRSNTDDSPGPGAYSPRDDITRRGPKQISLRTRHKEPKSQRQRNPGPGEYTPTDPNAPDVKRRTGKGFSFGKRGDLYKLPPHNVNFAQPSQMMSGTR